MVRCQLVLLVMRANFFGHSFQDWVSFSVSSVEELEWRSISATSCFFLGKWRNLEVHDVNYVSLFNPASVIRQYVHQYCASKGKFNPLSKGPKIMINVCWNPSSSGCVTVNTDGTSKETGSGCGGVLDATDGTWLGGFIRYLGDDNSYVAEFWGALYGLKFAKSMGLIAVELQMDSKAAVLVVTSGADGNIDGRVLLAGIWRLLQMDWEVNIIHVYREANSMADGFAAMVCDSQDALRFLDQPFAHKMHLLHSNCNGVVTPRLISR